MTTDPSGIITDVISRMEALTGCTRDELIGAPFNDYFTDPERAEAAIKLSTKQKEGYRLRADEASAPATEGKRWCSYNATTFYDPGPHVQSIFAAAGDVTTVKRGLEAATAVAENASRPRSDSPTAARVRRRSERR